MKKRTAKNFTGSINAVFTGKTISFDFEPTKRRRVTVLSSFERSRSFSVSKKGKTIETKIQNSAATQMEPAYMNVSVSDKFYFLLVSERARS